LLGKIWSGVGEAFVVEAGSGSPGALSVPGDARPRTLKRLAIDWAPPDLESFRRVSRPVDDIPAAGPAAPSFEWAGHTQRRVGIVVHALLQRLGPGDRVRDLEGTIEAALSVEGLAGDALTEAAQRVERALEQTLADPRGLWILDTHEEDRREYALTGTVDGRIRRVVIDRTFVDGPDRWIIDYKTGIHRGGGLEAFLDNERNRYRAQLDAYAQVVGQMDSRPIRLGLYFPLMGGWREWAWAPASDRVFRSHLPARTEQLPT
jgi:ATP-dependent exoDNAse (exonuclease V) beta subunit